MMMNEKSSNDVLMLRAIQALARQIDIKGAQAHMKVRNAEAFDTEMERIEHFATQILEIVYDAQKQG